MSALQLDRGEDGIVVATMDLPGSSMNVLNDALAQPLAALADMLEQDATVKGLILRSGKKDFLAGADIDRLRAIDSAQQAFDESMQLKRIIRRIEKCGKPVAALINGQCKGGGLELAMGCHWRIVIDDGRARLGLPEVKLGLLPGAGGTQRLPRLVGMQQALQWMAEGTDITAGQARSSGLVHALATDAADAMTQARAWIVANPKATQPWDAPKFRYPGGDSRSPAMVQLLAIGPSMASAKSYGNYPALTHIMSSVFEGGLTDIDRGLEIESRYFAACAASAESKNMIGTLWYQLNAIKKGASRPAGAAPAKVKKLGILGAGMMGAGIAYVSAKAGIQVLLLDSTQEAADKGKRYSQELLDKAVKKGRSTADKRDALLALITPTTRYELGRLFPLAAQQPAQQELIDRMMFAQANEAARCLQEGVLRSVADANIGSIFGWGFAPFQGGALQFINARGVPAFVARSRELAAAHGERFAPAQLLVEMAARGDRFPAH